MNASNVALRYLFCGSLVLATGCDTLHSIVSPEQARLEAEAKQEREKMLATKDGECNTAEYCKKKCETLERPLDCYRTGMAALRGVDVHYEGQWRAHKVGEDKYVIAKDADTQEHQSMGGLALQCFTTACKGDHPESCRRAGKMLLREGDTMQGNALLAKACKLKDADACETSTKAASH